MSTSKMEQERHDLRSSWKKHASCAKSLHGSDAIDAPLERSVVDWKQPKSKREPAKRSGTGPRLEACSTIQPTRVKPPSARLRSSHCALVCEHNEDEASSPNVPIPIMMFPPING